MATKQCSEFYGSCLEVNVTRKGTGQPISCHGLQLRICTDLTFLTPIAVPAMELLLAVIVQFRIPLTVLMYKLTHSCKHRLYSVITMLCRNLEK